MDCPKPDDDTPEAARTCSPEGAAIIDAKAPIGLIAGTWFLCACTFIPAIAFPCSLAMLVTSIMLVRSPNRRGKINGIVALVFWIVTFMIGFVTSFAASYSAAVNG